jgi:toxin YoeB
VRVQFTTNGWNDYQHWLENDPAILTRSNALIKDARRNPFQGLGKSEALKREVAGWWSGRIISEHRLVYRVEGKAAVDRRIEIAMCRNHYAQATPVTCPLGLAG